MSFLTELSLARRTAAYLLLYVAALLSTTVALSAEAVIRPTLVRYPNSSADRIAFVAHGELWTVPREGGLAIRLTDDPGTVQLPRFSPDGRWIAFTARRQGAQDVYVIPATGGTPRRLTFDGPSSPQGNLVLTWTPDSRRVVFLSQRGAWTAKNFFAYTVAVEGGLATALPLDSAGFLSFGPDADTIAYNRVFRNFDPRKRYVGGEAQRLYTYNFKTRQLQQIARWRGTDTFPMWYRRKIYFASDRGGSWRTNLWVYDLDTRRVRQITHFSDYDVDCPSLGTDALTFQQGGRLFAVELPSERLHEIKVDVPDDGARTGPRLISVAQAIRGTDIAGEPDYTVSPQGDAVVFSARGDLFAVNTGDGAARNLTLSNGADEDHPAWSPDGKTVAYVTDASQEEQIALRPADGGPERRITHFASGSLYTPLWSPDGQSLAVADANHNLWLLETTEADAVRIAVDAYAEIHDASFSPDGRWIVYSALRPNQQRAIHLYEIRTAQDTIVSSVMNSDRNPVFATDGSRLYFVSRRNEHPFVSDRDNETDVASLKSDGIYFASLDKSAPLSLAMPAAFARATPLPIVPGDIKALHVRGEDLFYQAEPLALIGDTLPGERSALHAFGPSGDRVLVEGLDHYVLSASGTRVLYRTGGEWRWLDTHAGAGAARKLNLDAMTLRVEPQLQWREMFEKAWRLDRDVFFDRGLYGTDWHAVHEAYSRLVPLLGSHADFMYLLGEMQGELATSHTFIGGGDEEDTRPAAHSAFLGADYAVDNTSGRYVFAHIYTGDNSRPRFRAPLAAAGMNIEPGDELLAVNGQDLRGSAGPDSVLTEAKAPVELTIASHISGAQRTVTVEPLRSEVDLRQYDWVEANRRRVSEASSGRLGYVFLADFSQDGSEDFLRQFYPQLDKEGLVIDVRWNRGGFTSQFVLNVLRRPLAGGFVNREGASITLPGAVVRGPMVTLTNPFSASDGDQFAYYFQAYGLGKVVGTRTWGGVRGIKGPWRLMDGTYVLIPKDSLFSPGGKWIIENEGAVPDVEVESRPDEVLTGHDAQLETAVRMLLEDLRRHPRLPLRAPPPIPAYPAGGDVPPASFAKKPVSE